MASVIVWPLRRAMRSAQDRERPPEDRWPDIARRGFTMVELMIVLAIVGVIAAWAVPAYQDYVARSRVGEGFMLAASARLTVGDNAANGVPFDLGFVPPSATRNVASLKIDPASGDIEIRYTPRVSGPDENRLVLVPSTGDGDATKGEKKGELTSETRAHIGLRAGFVPAGSITWECFAAGKQQSSFEPPGPAPVEAATLPARFAPAECRA
jgi:type IV pilus assembly protein PilA